MVATTTFRELLEQTDCRDVARTLWGEPVKVTSKRNLYHHKGGENTASLWVYADGFKNHGTGGEGGGIYAFIEYALECDRSRARQWLAEWHHQPTHQQAPRKPTPAQKQIIPLLPDQGWQSSAGKLVATCEAALWSDKGIPALDYLRHRGLIDDTIQAWQLGYHVQQNCITIPEYEGNTLVRVHRRFLSPDAQIRYQCITGSKITLYGGDLLDPNKPVVFVFGEFDALLGNQIAGDLAVFVTTGSDSNRLPKHWSAQLGGMEPFILCHDNDASGQQVATAEGLARLRLPTPTVITSTPSGKDLTDLVLLGGDLRGWLASVLEQAHQIIETRHTEPEQRAAPRPAWSSSMLPGYIHYLLNSDVPERALVLLALAAIGKLNQPATLSELADQDLFLGDAVIHLQSRTLRNILERDAGVVFDFRKDLYTWDWEDQESQVSKTFRNSPKRGRPGTVIQLKSPDDFDLDEEIWANIYRRYFPQGDKAELLPDLTIEHVQDSAQRDKSVPAAHIPRAHAEVMADDHVVTVYAEQDPDKRSMRIEAAERAFRKIQNQPFTRRSLTLPTWTIRNLTDFRAALYMNVTEQETDKNGECQRSSAYFALMLGTTRTTAINIASRLKDCIVQERMPLTPVKIQVESQIGANLGGHPMLYEVYDPVNDTTKTYSGFWSGAQAQVAAALRSQHEVSVLVQPANKQKIVSWEQPERPVRQRREQLPIATDAPVETAAPEAPTETLPRPVQVQWPVFDTPRQAYAWKLMINLLVRAKRIRLVGRGLYSRTGELLVHEPTTRDILFYLGATSLRSGDSPPTLETSIVSPDFSKG
jgi:hypothetical protein